MMNSALYSGVVGHSRFLPKTHHFKYRIFLLALDLDELDQLEDCGFWFRVNRPALLSFRPGDYLERQTSLTRSMVWEKIVSLGGENYQGRIVFLGQMRCLGFYFSPVNFYYCYDLNDSLCYLLAEVSNTPWHQRHYYLVNANKREATEKRFHVSPFMDMNLEYNWRFNGLQNQLLMCIKNQTAAGKLFSATLLMKRYPLNRRTIAQHVRRIPAMTIKTVAAIYWQALKLFLKRIPYVPYSQYKQETP